MPPLPGGGDLPVPGHLGHVADSEPNGTVPNQLQGSAALDEGRISGTGSRHPQADGEIPEGWSTFILVEGAEFRKALTRKSRFGPFLLLWRCSNLLHSFTLALI